MGYIFVMDVQILAKAWAKRIGYKVAVGRLVSAGVSARAAEMICIGEYPHKVKSLRFQILAEMAKDGFTLPSEAKSA